MKSFATIPMRLSVSSVKGYFSRMHVYLKEMFPLTGHLAIALLAALDIAGFAATVQRAHAAQAPALVVSTAWNIFAILLTLRLMDELKDEDIDRRLFSDRPLPSGRVLESDIRLSLVVVTALYLASNLRSPLIAVSSSFVLGYALLMYKRFFAPALLKKNLPITLLTHTPIIPLIWLQAFVTVSQLSGVSVSDMAWRSIALFVAMSWMMMLGWELSRKIRSSEEENEYVTYSQILGPAGAVAAAWAAQTVALGICIYLYFSFALGIPYLVLVGLGWVACCWAYARFLLRPNPRTSKFKPYASIFAFAILLAQVYGFVFAQS
jgi:4-hydroxybenzoate polyprenyltransferase